MNPPTDIIAQLERGLRSQSVAATEAAAAALAAQLGEQAVLALHGDLGAGKTSFVRGLARGWDIPGPITSPSFNLLNLYKGPQRTLAHVDAYRLQTPEQAEGLLLDDLLLPPWCLAVEWPEQFPQYRLHNAWVLQLSILRSGVHEIRLLRRPPSPDQHK